MDERQLQMLEMLIGLGQSNPTNSAIFNQTMQMVPQLMQGGGDPRKEQLTNMLMEQEAQKMMAGDADAAGRLDVLMNEGYDGYMKTMNPSLSGGEMGSTDEGVLAQQYARALQLGDQKLVNQLQQQNPDYAFEYDPEVGASVNLKGGGLGEMLLGQNRAGAIGDTFLQKFKDNLIGTENDPTAMRAQRLATSFGGIRPLFETIYEGTRGDSDAQGYMQERLNRQRLRKEKEGNY